MEVPLWAAILIGLGAGAVGTLLQIGHERGTELRTRMVEAADDFSTSIFHALRTMRDAVSVVHDLDLHAPVGEQALLDPSGTRGEWLPPLQDAIKDVNARIDDVHACLARIHLLFGERETHVGGIALETVVALRMARDDLGDWPNSVLAPPASKTYGRRFQTCVDLHAEFNREASRWLRSYAFQRAWWRLSARARSVPKRLRHRRLNGAREKRESV